MNKLLPGPMRPVESKILGTFKPALGAKVILNMLLCHHKYQFCNDIHNNLTSLRWKLDFMENILIYWLLVE